jgi:hypothetical protein
VCGAARGTAAPHDLDNFSCNYRTVPMRFFATWCHQSVSVSWVILLSPNVIGENRACSRRCGIAECG